MIPKKTQKQYMSDDDTSDEESDPQLRTTPEERDYGTIPGSAQATQAALSYSKLIQPWNVDHLEKTEAKIYNKTTPRQRHLRKRQTRNLSKSISTFYKL